VGAKSALMIKYWALVRGFSFLIASSNFDGTFITILLDGHESHHSRGVGTLKCSHTPNVDISGQDITVSESHLDHPMH
jgi:hypothetical protein